MTHHESDHGQRSCSKKETEQSNYQMPNDFVDHYQNKKSLLLTSACHLLLAVSEGSKHCLAG
jgi:hypothetical protein